jgi:hypothetical protein
MCHYVRTRHMPTRSGHLLLYIKLCVCTRSSRSTEIGQHHHPCWEISSGARQRKASNVDCVILYVIWCTSATRPHIPHRALLTPHHRRVSRSISASRMASHIIGELQLTAHCWEIFIIDAGWKFLDGSVERIIILSLHLIYLPFAISWRSRLLDASNYS